MTKVKNIVGLKVGLLTVIERAGRDKFYAALWKCSCECGNFKNYTTGSLLSGNYKTCGCRTLKKARRKKINPKSGLREYKIWRGMLRRCNNKNYPFFKSYGGRGIRVCDRWTNSYENFIADMGKSPTPKHSIDRIDNSGNYEPGNCRWATQKEQMANTSRTIKVGNKSLLQASKDLGVLYGTVLARIKRGWSLEKALNVPKLSNGYDIKKIG